MNRLWGSIAVLLLLFAAGCGRAHNAPLVESGRTELLQPAIIDNERLSAELNPDGSLLLKLDEPDGHELLGSTASPAGLPDGQLLSASGSGCMALAHSRNGLLEVAIASHSGSLPDSLLLEPLARSSSAVKSNQVSDLLILHAADNYLHLTWTMHNRGDYDHNGVVGVSDLIPIAVLFGSQAAEGTAWDPQDREFHVDGDGNNLINASDIATIAQNFGNDIDHYNLYANGDLLQQVALEDGIFTQGSGLPPRFSLLIAKESIPHGSALSLVPVSRNGSPAGPPSSGAADIELSVRSEFKGMELLDLCEEIDPSSSGIFAQGNGPCHSILRIIDPIDDIGSWEPPSGFIPEFNTILFTNLERGKLCYVENSFLPSVDPASGQPNASEGPDSEGLQRISYPVILPDDGNGYEVRMSISAVDNPSGGSFTDVSADSSIPGRIQAAPLRLDNNLSRVARDLDFDGNYDDESWLRDEDRDSLSDSLEERLRTEQLYHDQPGMQVVGTVLDILPERGELLLANAVLYSPSGGEEQLGELTVRYTEMTPFEATNPINQTLEPRRLRAVEIETGRPVVVDCSVQRLSPSGEAVRFWADNISQQEAFADPDTVYIVPALTQRRPGQVVNVTVYASETASAFNGIREMTLHVLGAAEIVEGSINPGVQGGADNHPDGIWELLGPEPLSMDARIYTQSFGFGRYYQNFDVSIDPVSSLNLSNASGALFNFDLRIYEPAVVLAGYRYKEPISRYADAQGNAYDWNSQADEDALYVDIIADQPKLLLFDEALAGDGSYWNPYVIETGQRYRLQVVDEIDLDITENPNTWYVVSDPSACYIDYSDPVIELDETYTGQFSVHVLYPGMVEIPDKFADRIYFRTP